MRISFAAIAVLMLSVSALAQGSVHPNGYRLVVHPSSQVATLSKDFVADAFLKKVTRWPNGEPIRPVDLSDRSAARHVFVERVLSRSMSAVRSYWQQQIFSGRNIPPPELDTDADVVAYVAKHRGAIGYVSLGADTASVKAVAVK